MRSYKTKVMKYEVLAEDSFYHIYNKGNNDENLFIDEKNYGYFLQLLKKHVLSVCNILAYCLLRNHFHLLIKTKEKVEIVTLKNIAERYKQNDIAFVEYILHETEGYGLFYDGNAPILFKIDQVESFQKQLQSLRTLMTKPTLNSQARKEIQIVAALRT